jgi:hypothetical protein
MFNEDEHIRKCQPYVKKLVDDLSKDNITFEPDNGCGNVVFTKDEKTCVIAHHCFYRFSGLCRKYKVISVGKKGVMTVEEIPISLEEFITSYMKACILKTFENK